MNLIRFFFRGSRPLMLGTVAASLVSAACQTLLIALVTRALSDRTAPAHMMIWFFVAIVGGRLIANFVAQILLANFAQRSSANLRRDLVGKILNVPLRQLEEIGAPRLMVSLTEDVLSLTEAMLGIPTFAMNAAILVGGAIYLGWLSWTVLVLMGCFIVVGAVGYRILIRSGFWHLFQARD